MTTHVAHLFENLFKIGNIELSGRTVFAPMAGITNLPMRLLAKEAGCALVCSEMISSHALVHGTGKTLQMLASAPEEKPLSIQLFGADPDILARAGRRAAQSGADILDINFGCSVKKIIKSGSGAALMRDLRKASDVLRKVRAAVEIPLTIKIRSGWDASGDQALELCRIAEDSGVDAVTVHPRTARQGFSGRADWSIIGRIKRKVHIPVIGNGDINSVEDAVRMLAQTGCDAVMLGRGAIGNPFIFSQIGEFLAGGRATEVTASQRIALMRRFLQTSVHHMGEKRACLMMRSRLGWFSRGMPGAGCFRHAIRHIESQQQGLALIADFEAQVFREATQE